jgi:hypothetical protein
MHTAKWTCRRDGSLDTAFIGTFRQCLDYVERFSCKEQSKWLITALHGKPFKVAAPKLEPSKVWPRVAARFGQRWFDDVQ